MAVEKNNGKPLKPKFAKIEKRNASYYQFWVADDEWSHIKVFR